MHQMCLYTIIIFIIVNCVEENQKVYKIQQLHIHLKKFL